MESKWNIHFDFLSLKALARSEAVPVVFAGALLLFMGHHRLQSSAEQDSRADTISIGEKGDFRGTKLSTPDVGNAEQSGDHGGQGNWVKRYCKLKSNLMFFYAASDSAYPDSAFLLEDVAVEVMNSGDAVKRKIVPFLPQASIPKEAKTSVILYVTNLSQRVLGKPLEKLIVYFPNFKGADSWKKKIDDSKVSTLQRILKEDENDLKRQKLAMEKSIKSKELRISDLEAELNDLRTKDSQLRLEVERLGESNKRLQNSGEVTEKAAAEYVDQKLCEVAALQKHLAEALAEREDAVNQNRVMREKLNDLQRTVHQLSVGWAKSREELQNLLTDYEEADRHPQRIAIQLKKLRDRNQHTCVENKRLRAENRELTENFHSTERRLKEKVACLKSICEAGDVFDYLRKWLTCSEYKIKYLENGFSMEAEKSQELREKVSNLQQDVRVSEAVARSSFIAHRSRILAEQLKCYTSRIPISDYCSLARKTLDRFSWIFGEAEVAVPEGLEATDSETPWWHFAHSSPRDMIPLRDNQFRSGGIEGNKRWPLVEGVDVLAPVSPMIPLREHRKVVHECKTLGIRLRELEDDYDRLVERLARYKYASQESKLK